MIKELVTKYITHHEQMSGKFSNLIDPKSYTDDNMTILYQMEQYDSLPWKFKPYVKSGQTFPDPPSDDERLKIPNNVLYERLKTAECFEDLLLPKKLPPGSEDVLSTVYRKSWNEWKTRGKQNKFDKNEWLMNYMKETVALKDEQLVGIGDDEHHLGLVWGTERSEWHYSGESGDEKDWRYQPDSINIRFISENTGYSEHYLDIMFRYFYRIGIQKDKAVMEIRVKNREEEAIRRREEEARDLEERQKKMIEEQQKRLETARQNKEKAELQKKEDKENIAQAKREITDAQEQYKTKLKQVFTNILQDDAESILNYIKDDIDTINSTTEARVDCALNIYCDSEHAVFLRPVVKLDLDSLTALLKSIRTHNEVGVHELQQDVLDQIHQENIKKEDSETQANEKQELDDQIKKMKSSDYKLDKMKEAYIKAMRTNKVTLLDHQLTEAQTNNLFKFVQQFFTRYMQCWNENNIQKRKKYAVSKGLDLRVIEFYQSGQGPKKPEVKSKWEYCGKTADVGVSKEALQNWFEYWDQKNSLQRDGLGGKDILSDSLIYVINLVQLALEASFEQMTHLQEMKNDLFDTQRVTPYHINLDADVRKYLHSLTLQSHVTELYKN